jgi:hypothetical protein
MEHLQCGQSELGQAGCQKYTLEFQYLTHTQEESKNLIHNFIAFSDCNNNILPKLNYVKYIVKLNFTCFSLCSFKVRLTEHLQLCTKSLLCF